MYFLPVSLALFFVLLFLIPVLFVIAPAVAFAKLGLNPITGYLFFFLCLIGGGINIPLIRNRHETIPSVDEETAQLLRFFGIKIPRISEQIIAVNVGGAILPGLLCIYLLTLAPFAKTIIATLITSSIAYMVSRPVRGIGIVIPTFIPPVAAAATAVIMAMIAHQR